MGALRLALSARRPQTPTAIISAYVGKANNALMGALRLALSARRPQTPTAIISAFVGKANNALYSVKGRGRASRSRGQARFPCACPLDNPPH